MSEVKRSRAPRYHAGDLNKLNLIIVSPLLLNCGWCGKFFEPVISSGGRLFGRWWICPNACADDLAKQK